LSVAGGEACRMVNARAALPSGAGFIPGAIQRLSVYAFLPGGLLPFVTSVFFLGVLGGHIEERVKLWPYLGLFVFSALVAGMAHMSLGRVGAPSALGPSGAVAGVLGAYLVFFPNVPIRMYGMGRVMSVPAYLFACIWIVALLVNGYGMGGLGGWVRGFLDPFPLSIWGSLAGFGSGALFALAIRGKEEGII
jgi:membrane associated rhomboid family serine protease